LSASFRCSTLYFCLTVPSSSVICTLSLHDALPIFAAHVAQKIGVHERRFALLHQDAAGLQRLQRVAVERLVEQPLGRADRIGGRSEEHTSELQSRENLVCRLLLEKKKKSDTSHD